MSDFLEIKDNLKQVNQSLKQMDKAVRQAVLSSINRSTQRAKTEMGRKVREKYIVKQAEVVKTVSIRKAKGKALSATLTSRGYTIPLIRFGVTPKKQLKKAPKVIKAAVFRGGAKKPIPGAFIATVGSHLGVFKREGKKRLPIRELRGPAVPSMAVNDEVREHVQSVYADEMQKRLPHELNRTLGRLKA
ncbi:phage tail protein [Paenibacillus sp. 3LSP]|uniref:phage tail protein n=1 Tax=Paenibacillus sp. 3LSP TaxID=2800795 RepID=UPI0028FD3650|nr:phage tail protein [Paenibacillus sp. 3LSP]MDU0332544.1 phage tail protein [Paenibacillus sp. 3LSP]